jgi:hypothetical protein
MTKLNELIKTDIEKKFIRLAKFMLKSEAEFTNQEMVDVLKWYANGAMLLLDQDGIKKYIHALSNMQFIDEDDCVFVYLEIFKPTENA